MPGSTSRLPPKSVLFIPSSSIIEYEPDTPHIFFPAAGALSNASWNYNNAYDLAMVSHIQQYLADGWQLKDSIEWDRYEQALAEL